MANFLDVASDLYRADKLGDVTEHFQRVFSAIGKLQVVHSKAQLNLTNIESIFTALELGRVIQRVPGLTPAEIPQVIESLKELIVKTLELTIRFPTRRAYIDVPKPYEDFATLLRYLRADAFPKQSVSVITFNYDVAVDFALYRAGLGPRYIVAGEQSNPNNLVDLMKLHGSLNWATEVETNRINVLDPDAYLRVYSVRGFEEQGNTTLPIGTQLAEYFSKHAQPASKVYPAPVIVPPTWNKSDYHQALSDVWKQAADHLAEAESIFVIGYSLPETDSFFRHLFALGSVGESTLRRFVVFNPDMSGSTDERFRSLLGPGSLARYQYKPIDFASSLGEIRHLFPNRG